MGDGGGPLELALGTHGKPVFDMPLPPGSSRDCRLSDYRTGRALTGHVIERLR